MQDELHEECGICGVYAAPKAAYAVYNGLHALQHRGQEGAGVAVSDGAQLACRKGKGLLTEAIPADELKKLPGCAAIGHVRYATSGGGELENVQPMVARAHMGVMAVSHNGQIVNAARLQRALEKKGSIFHGTSDSEILLHLLQGAKGTLLEKLKETCLRLEGAFSFLLLTEKSLYAVRDKNGLRPLSLATLGEGFCAASETCAFAAAGARYLREVLPGEIVKISKKGVESVFYAHDTQLRLCAMEYVYFARPDSDLEGKNVHTLRRTTGRLLAEKDREEGLAADIVAGVPDSSLSAAMGYSEKSGIAYEMALIKNRYVGRTFIQPTQALRDLTVTLKLSTNASVVKGKRLVLVDDSIVRGTTSKRIVRLLKEAGAKEVHLRIASPPILYPCFYGVDTSTREELISAKMKAKELCAFIGADSLRFLTPGDLRRAFGKDCCLACFTGAYPTPLYAKQKRKLEKP